MTWTHLVFPLSQLWSQLFLQGSLVSFIGEWYLETKVWMIGVLIATGVPLSLGFRVGRAWKHIYAYWHMYPHVYVDFSVQLCTYVWVSVYLRNSETEWTLWHWYDFINSYKLSLSYLFDLQVLFPFFFFFGCCIIYFLNKLGHLPLTVFHILLIIYLLYFSYSADCILCSLMCFFADFVSNKLVDKMHDQIQV